MDGMDTASQWRQDVVTGRWLIIAPARAARPVRVATPPRPADDPDTCPFCRLSAEPTAERIVQWTGPDGPVTVVANKYPSLQVLDGPLSRGFDGPHNHTQGLGAHEVFIETDAHTGDLSDLSVGQLAAVVRAWRDRVRDLQRDHRLRAFYVFRNKGHWGGASLSHPHSQLVATPLVPRNFATELNRAWEHYTRTERCLLDDVVAHEMQATERIVRLDEGMVSLCPYASRVPFETWIVSRRHGPFTLLRDDDASALADHLKDVLTRLHQSLPGLDYNLALHTAPNPWGTAQPGLPPFEAIERWWRWRITIMPRLNPVAGLEWMSGVFVNPTPPEQAAEHLRNVAPTL